MVLNDKNQRATLVSYISAQDSSGFTGESERVETVVWCKVASVSGNEIATMGQNNIKPSLRITVWVAEYCGQDEVEIDGVPYGVYRTYQPGMDEIDLYLERKGGL